MKVMKLRKTSLIAVCSVCALAATAQSTPTKEFNPHWTLGLQGGAAYTRGEADFSDLISPAASLSMGYHFSPVFSLRGNATGWQAKGGWVTPAATYSYKYVQVGADAVFNLSNLFCGYSATRVMNVSAFLGAAANMGFDNDEAVALAAQGYDLRYLWSDKRFSPVGRAGLGVDFRLSNRVSLGIEANANILSDHFNSKRAGNPDWQFNLLGGIKINLGKTHKAVPVPVVPPVQQPVEEPAPAPTPAPAPAVEDKKEDSRPEMTQNIFFKINSATPSAKEQEKIVALVDFLKANPDIRVSVTGYADAGTGTRAINDRISRRRANAVADILVRKGIERSRIDIAQRGDTVQPFAKNEENRVTICIAQ